MNTEPLAYTVEEAASALRVSRDTVYRLIKQRRLTPVENLTPTRIAVRELERFAADTGTAA